MHRVFSNEFATTGQPELGNTQAKRLTNSRPPCPAADGAGQVALA